jgi:hypothetical protein
MYGDYTFGCLHGKEYFSTFIDGETIEKLIPSFKLSLTERAKPQSRENKYMPEVLFNGGAGIGARLCD